ncbi:DEHA2B15202p [Debaryomyces hansenii CBS767]|jgi:hypothetical protein|uniref:DEHA2B15202p n=1 Tax=Debaryomyces hansenii (strain ATCC 36239 / CBS 767 / BCRC 21394 / JCM 1990 / NBRC 0083 / IGC 2968) TaxID=284592 RepID=Q6BW09_DEBHA|nr:DEHA2B15202p [Debaryomyces hansenii CBS767]CAG85621.2 DEHA2B15202p [Debaryomyces hansenii CBS767]|eukprot:XP_457610.2 DEHA2B15202p [Debaryomyces hansenii CBS767]
MIRNEMFLNPYTLRIDIGTEMKNYRFNECNSNENQSQLYKTMIGSAESDSDRLFEVSRSAG